jgi:succinate dehydrogenase / fumarate reductase membrane anchor subunit
MSLVNPLARARGHGSAQDGVHHWYMQRASAVALIFLVAWLIYAMVALAGSGQAAAAEFISRPLNAGFFILLLIAMFYHAMLGLQVVIEDYVHQRALEIILQLGVKAAAYTGMVIGVIYVLKLALGA